MPQFDWPKGLGKTGTRPEVGKSDAFAKSAKFHGIPIVDFRVVRPEPADFAGLPKWEKPDGT